MLKRLFDTTLAFLGLLFLAPLLMVVALAVHLSSPGPVLFCQRRVGRFGRSFILYKFRTMHVLSGTENGRFDAGITSRITSLGRLLRATKVDELPQLWNVLTGSMSLVGPRPEVQRWVDAYPQRWAPILTIRPGITDPASVYYRNEEALLAATADPETTYREIILPHKLTLYENYLLTQSFRKDVKLLFATVVALLFSHWQRP